MYATLTINGEEISARADQTHSGSGARTQHPDSDAVPSGRAVGSGRLPVVPGGGEGSAATAAGLRDAGGGGHGSHDAFSESRSYRHDDPGDVFCGAEPRLLGLRGQRALRAAGPGADAGDDARGVSLPVSAAAGGRFASSASRWTTIAASCARAACECARRSKGRTPGT